MADNKYEPTHRIHHYLPTAQIVNTYHGSHLSFEGNTLGFIDQEGYTVVISGSYMARSLTQ